MTTFFYLGLSCLIRSFSVLLHVLTRWVNALSDSLYGLLNVLITDSAGVVRERGPLLDDPVGAVPGGGGSEV